MSEILKPCPFCGGQVKLVADCPQTKDPVYCFECEECGALVYMDDLIDKDKSIEAWNKRPNPWHTRTPTEGGLYFVYEKYVGYAKRDLPTNISKKDLEDSFYNVIAWQKIEPYEASN